MAKVQYYRGLNTNLDNLYNSIKQLLKDQKDLQIVSEYKGLLNAIPLRSVVAVNKSPKVNGLMEKGLLLLQANWNVH